MPVPPPPRTTVFTTAQLIRDGYTRHRLRTAVAAGTLRSVRQGVYATPDAPAPLVRAVRLGGRATSVTALRHHGVWAPEDDRLHVRVARDASRLRDPDTALPFRPRPDVVLHWTGSTTPRHADPSVDEVASAIIALQRHHPPDFVVAAIDSALHRTRCHRGELVHAFSAAGPVLSHCLAVSNAKAESGTESVARVRLADAGIVSEPQVWFGRHRVDLLIDGWLDIELDGREHHGSAEESWRDYRRDAELTRQGLHVLHFSYGQVFGRWPSVLTTVRAVLATGRPSPEYR